MDSSPEVNTDNNAKFAFKDTKSTKPLSNPPVSHRLCTNQYTFLSALKSDLHKFTASAGFCII